MDRQPESIRTGVHGRDRAIGGSFCPPGRPSDFVLDIPTRDAGSAHIQKGGSSTTKLDEPLQ